MTTLLTNGAARGRAVLDDDVDLARDRVLVTRAQAGDRAAFDDLYLRYSRRLYRFCLRRLHDSHEAEDVAQEAFARAWRALPSFGGDRRFYPWLSVIAAHLCTDVLRRRNRSSPVAEFHQQNVASGEEGGEELMIAAVDSDLVAKAFTRLSDRHQRILHLREGSGWSYQRIADHEGVGITAVETLLWRARQALKREFSALASSEGRSAAFGGLLTLAMLRKLLGAPLRIAHRATKLGLRNTALAAGSAAAATAVAVTAAIGGLSSPAGQAHGTPSVSVSAGHGQWAPGWVSISQQAALEQAAQEPASGGPASGGSAPSSSGPLTGLPGLQVAAPDAPLLPGPGTNQAQSTLSNTLGAASSTLKGTAADGANSVTGTVDSTVSGANSTAAGAAPSAPSTPKTNLP